MEEISAVQFSAAIPLRHQEPRDPQQQRALGLNRSRSAQPPESSPVSESAQARSLALLLTRLLHASPPDPGLLGERGRGEREALSPWAGRSRRRAMPPAPRRETGPPDGRRSPGTPAEEGPAAPAPAPARAARPPALGDGPTPARPAGGGLPRPLGPGPSPPGRSSLRMSRRCWVASSMSMLEEEAMGPGPLPAARTTATALPRPGPARRPRFRLRSGPWCAGRKPSPGRRVPGAAGGGASPAPG